MIPCLQCWRSRHGRSPSGPAKAKKATTPAPGRRQQHLPGLAPGEGAARPRPRTSTSPGCSSSRWTTRCGRSTWRGRGGRAPSSTAAAVEVGEVMHRAPHPPSPSAAHSGVCGHRLWTKLLAFTAPAVVATRQFWRTPSTSSSHSSLSRPAPRRSSTPAQSCSRTRRWRRTHPKPPCAACAFRTTWRARRCECFRARTDSTASASTSGCTSASPVPHARRASWRPSRMC
mmetsp:Transcript_85003/g.245486  ORF Transcript_85003/g.245486 Transcript_85003/m.245486 type:complete len:229 (+) Transcript_85003:1216-1902(+)